MRTIIITTMIALFAVVAIADDNRLTKRDARKLVEEYLDDDTTTTRRIEIRSMLKKADRGLAATPLRRGASDEETVGLAVELAAELQVRGLFRDASDYLDGDYEDLILDYGMKLREDKAAETAWERWKAKEKEGTSWTIANKALLKYPVPLKIIEGMKKFLDGTEEGDDLREPCARIFRFQLGLDGTSIEKIDEDWKEIIALYKADAKSFNLSGVDLLVGEYSTIGPVQQVGGNMRLANGSRLLFEATDDWNTGDFSMVARVRVVEDCEIKVVVGAEYNAWMAWHKDGEWIVTPTRGNRVVPGKPGKWVTIRFDVTVVEPSAPSDDVEVRDFRTCAITVDGKKLLEEGRLNGPMERLDSWVTNHKAGKCTIGGVEFINR